MYTPKEITQCKETGIHTASFKYYDGIEVAAARGLKQSVSFVDVTAGTHFIVCCGDVMFKVEPTEYPDVIRRLF